MRNAMIEQQWSVLLASEHEPFRSMLEIAYREPVLRSKFPFLSHKNLRFSTATEYPYDWNLPYIALTESDEFEARNGDNSPIARGDLNVAVRATATAMQHAMP
jgi:hypothetical protein